MGEGIFLFWVFGNGIVVGKITGKLFRDNDIENGIVKLGREYSQKGCGHGIKIDCRSRQYALKLLKEEGIPYSDVRQL